MTTRGSCSYSVSELDCSSQRSSIAGYLWIVKHFLGHLRIRKCLICNAVWHEILGDKAWIVYITIAVMLFEIGMATG